jgi:hypothetical protein
VILQLEALADILRTAGSDVEMRHKVETAAELLKPFRVATDRVQRADATIFSCLSTWEALLGSLDDRLRQVIISRFSSMLRGPYLIAAFFSPVVNSLAYARVLDPVVVEQLEAISPAAAAEYQEYRRHPRTPPVTQCTLASYLLHVENTLDQKWPALAVAVRCCVLSTPTEAAVERGFSHMKFIINDWRNKVASNTAENLVVAQSCFKMLNEMSKSVAQSKARQEAATPSTDRLPATASQGSPTPQDPSQAVLTQAAAAGEDPDPFIAHEAALAARTARPAAVRRTPVEVEGADMQHVEYDEDDPAAEGLPAYVTAGLTPEQLTASATTIMDQVLKHCVATVQGARPPPPPARNTGANTRLKADRCEHCGGACAAHEMKAWIQCHVAGCTKRVSASHNVELCLAVYHYSDEALQSHQALDLVWYCPEHLESLRSNK